MNRNRNQYNKQQNTLTAWKIDGLFISDCAVPEDTNFLVGNKIIRILGWTHQSNHHLLEEEDILEFNLDKNQVQIKFPPFEKLQDGFTFFDSIHDQMLCGLIYSESELQAAIICMMYLMHRHHWNCSTSYAFIKNKIDIFQFSDQALEGLEDYERQLQKSLKIKLSNVLWQYQFLVNYLPETDEEQLIINTIKNKLNKNSTIVQEANLKQRKTKKIRWWDKPRSTNTYSIGKNLAGRTSQIKGRFLSPTHCFMLPVQSQLGSNRNLQLISQSYSSKGPLNNYPKEKKPQKENQWQQDTEYQQLKEMSRTNFNDRRYMSSKLRRRSSLKPKKDLMHKSSSTLENINKIVGIYSNGNASNFRPSSANISNAIKIGGGQMFLSSIRQFNKLSLGNA